MDKETLKRHIKDCDTILLGKEKYRIFGITSYAIKKRVIENCPFELGCGEALACLKPGKIMEFYATHDINREQVMFVLLHELMHLMCKHLSRKGSNLEQYIYNISADHVVNRELICLAEQTNIIQPIEGCIYFPDIEQKFNKPSVEEVYNYLKKETEQNEEIQNGRKTKRSISDFSDTPRESLESDGGNRDGGDEENSGESEGTTGESNQARSPSEGNDDSNGESGRKPDKNGCSGISENENREGGEPEPPGSRDRSEESGDTKTSGADRTNSKSNDKNSKRKNGQNREQKSGGGNEGDDDSGIGGLDNAKFSGSEKTSINNNSFTKYKISVVEYEDGSTTIEVTNKYSGKKYKALLDTTIPKSEDIEEDFKKIEQMTEDVENIFRLSKMLWNSGSISRGLLPGNFEAIFDETFKIEVPWDIILENAILYSVQAAKRRSWSEPNFYIRKAKVPGKIPKSKNPNILLVSIDTSASISDMDLSRFLGIVLDSLKHYYGMYIIQHDTRITKEDFYNKRPSEDKLFEEIRTIKGRGGTCHTEVFDKIEEITKRENVSTILFLTDYYSNVSSIYENYDFIKQNETIWMLTSDLEVELDDCRTKTLKINI